MEHINKEFPHSIYVTDVGQHQMWATQYLELDEESQLITSGGLGTMGFGFPAAIGAKIANRDKDVVLVTGDGGFQMNIQEMATAVTQGTNITICLLNNYYLGMVRQMQELFYGKRYSATCLRKRPGCPNDCKGPNEESAHSLRSNRVRALVPDRRPGGAGKGRRAGAVSCRAV